MYFHYIIITATVFCPLFGPYHRKGLCDLAESRLIGTDIRCLIMNSHRIRGVSIPICGFMFLNYIPIAATAFCPPPGSYLRNCLCDLAESCLVGMTMRWFIRIIHKISGIFVLNCVILYFHYIIITATVFCPPFGPYLRKGLCDLAESRLIGTAMRCLLSNTHRIRGVSIPICGFMFLHYTPIAATVFCPPPGSYLRNCLCDLAESCLVGMTTR